MLVDRINPSSLEVAVFVPALDFWQCIQHLFHCQISGIGETVPANWAVFAYPLECFMTAVAKAVAIFALVNRRIQQSLETDWTLKDVF